MNVNLSYVLAGLAAAALLYVITVYNRLVHYRQMVKEAVSDIDVQLKKRFDLIPSIVDSVRSYASFEKNLFESVTKARANLSGISDIFQRSGLETELSKSLKPVIALAEQYPELKASGNFIDLQDTLVDVEDHIQMARRYYNGTVRNLNIMLQSFPSNLVGNAFKFQEEKYFEIEFATERRLPEVNI